jgi:hypothetical protein
VSGNIAEEPTGLTSTTTVLRALPPGPVQSNVNAVVADRLPLDSVPDGGLLPVHPPDAVHEAVSVLVQLRVTLLPDGVLLRLVIKDTVGAWAEPPTTTVTVREALPPGPVQRIV